MYYMRHTYRIYIIYTGIFIYEIYIFMYKKIYWLMQLKGLRSSTVLRPPAGGPAELGVKSSDFTALTTRWWVSLSPRAGEDQGPAQIIGQEEWIPLPSPFCSTQAFTKQDTAHPRCGGSADSKAKLFRKHPETAFNQPSGPAVAWSSWHMKLAITLAHKEPGCLVPRGSDTSPSRDQWPHVAEPELRAWVRVHQPRDRIHARVLRGVRPGPKALRGQGDVAKKTKQKMNLSNHPSLVNTW